MLDPMADGSNTPGGGTPPGSPERNARTTNRSDEDGRINGMAQEMREAALERAEERLARRRMEERLEMLISRQMEQPEETQETASGERYVFNRNDARAPSPAEESTPPTDNSAILRRMEEMAEEVSRLRKDKLAGQGGTFAPRVSPFSAHILERGRDPHAKITNCCYSHCMHCRCLPTCLIRRGGEEDHEGAREEPTD